MACPQAAAGWAGQRGRQGSGESGQGCCLRREREQDLAAWLCCHGVSREMVLPRIIRADGLVLLSAPDGWGGEGGERVPAGSGHCWAQAWPHAPSPGHPGAAAGHGARQRLCCLPWRAQGLPAPQHCPQTPSLTAASFADGAIYALGGMGADTSPQALVRVYEPAKDLWQPLPSMPTPCYGASAFLQGNKIFVLGRCHRGEPSVPPCPCPLPPLPPRTRE